MEVILIRHAEAESAKPQQDDAERALTALGESSARLLAKQLRSLLGRAAVLSSPLIRAVETARIFSEELGASSPQIVDELSPGGSIKALYATLASMRLERVALVGHEPQLTAFIAVALGGNESSVSLSFSKLGVCAVQFRGSIAPGRAVLRWFLSGDLLKASLRGDHRVACVPE